MAHSNEQSAHLEQSEAADSNNSLVQGADPILLLGECYRYAALSDLRKRFEKLWKVTCGQAAPAESFNAWLFESLNAAEPEWPPIPGPLLDSRGERLRNHSPALETWALLQVPAAWAEAKTVDDAKRSLEQYSAALLGPASQNQKIWEGLPSDSIAVAVTLVKDLQEEAFSEAADVLKEVQRKLHPLVAAAIRSKVTDLSMNVSALADDSRHVWHEKLRQISASFEGNQDLRVSVMKIQEETTKGRTQPQKIRLELHGKLPDDVHGRLPRRFEIHQSHVEKLRYLFDHSSDGSLKHRSFEAACWALLSRYQALYGPHDEGAGWHMALTPAVLQNLSLDFGVECELFASPLNCTLSSYCSLFKDTDGPFGSRGSFFNLSRSTLQSLGGSYECNPPFDEHLMQRVVATLLEALTITEQPLSIALVMPDWSSSKALTSATGSSFCQATIRISGEYHVYLNGRQHSCQPRHRKVRQTYGRGSCVIFLQNCAGAVRWSVTEDKLERHRRSWANQDESFQLCEAQRSAEKRQRVED